MQRVVHLRCRVFWTLAALPALIVLLSAGQAAGQAQTKDQQKCTNAMNKEWSKVSKEVNKQIQKCLKNYANGKALNKDNPDIDTLNECLLDDPKGKIAKKKAKTYDSFEKKCVGVDKNEQPRKPPYGVAAPYELNIAAAEKEQELLHDLFAGDLDSGVILLASGADDPNSWPDFSRGKSKDAKDATKCQQAVLKAVSKCQQEKQKQWLKCKKDGLKAETITDPNGIAACMDGVDASKMAKKCVGLPDKGILKAINKKCVEKVEYRSLDQLFPGACAEAAAAGPEELANCLDSAVECRFCLSANAADGVDRDCDRFDDGSADGSCPAVHEYPESIGGHTCVFDDRAFCEGGDRDGLPCTDPVIHSECPPVGARCIQRSNFFINTLLASPQLTLPLIGSTDVVCGSVDPNTGKASCTCQIIETEGVDIIGIGAVCVVAGSEPCPAGEIDCDGGNPLDAETSHDHEIGDCGLDPPYDGDAECNALCESYCAGLEGDFGYLNSGCEGFCRGGVNHGQTCDVDGDCPGGDCVGANPVAHANVCNCQCLEIGGDPSRRGGLLCNVRAGIDIERELPCDGLDVTMSSLKICVPFTTERAAGRILHANRTGASIGPVSDRGDGVDCAHLAVGNLADLRLVADIGFIDTGLGDMEVQFHVICE